MQLEAKEPSHGGFSSFGNTLEGFVAWYAFIVANPYNSGIYKANSRAFTSAAMMQEKHKYKGVTVAKCNEAVVGNQVGEITF